MTSIRTRITSAVVGCTALVVAVAALIAGTTARAMLEKGLDERLHGRLVRWVTPIWRSASSTDSKDGSRDGSREGQREGQRDGSRDERDGRDRGDTRDGRDGAEGRETPATPATPEQQALQQWVTSSFVEAKDEATGEELARSPWLPAGVSLVDFGVMPGDPIRTVRLPDGTPIRLLAVKTESVTRTRSRNWDARDGRDGRDGGRDGRDGDRDGRDSSRDEGRETHESPEEAAAETPPSEPPPQPERRPAIAWLAVDATSVESEARRLAWILAAVWAGATALAWIVSRQLSRTVLRPVQSLSRTIESLSPQSLASRVPMEAVPAELSTVVARLNGLLEKVETAFQRERATIANMAHELRTPISALRTTLEFGLYQGLSPQHRKTLESSLNLTLRMQALVNGLLTLTRIEAGQEVLAREQVDVVRVLKDAWITVEARAGERGITASFRVPATLPLMTSSTHVEMVAANLLDNAVAHGAPNGAVEIELAGDGEKARLTISNPCKGASSKGRSRYFEPFWRSDPARSNARHFGLGLALCDRVVRLLGGTIEASETSSDGSGETGRFTVTVTLPGSQVPGDRAIAAA